MPLYLSVPDLKEIKSIYGQLGISNSAVLDQIILCINSNHFTLEDVEEIVDVTSDWKRIAERNDIPSPKTIHAIEQVNLLHRIHAKAQNRKPGSLAKVAV